MKSVMALLTVALLTVLCSALVAVGCACPAPTSAHSDDVRLPRIEEGTGLLFTFFDRGAQMRTVDRFSEIPAESKKAVMVTTMGNRLSEDRVFIADLAERSSQEQGYRVWIEERGQWLDRVMPRASVAKLELPKRRARRQLRRSGRRRAAPAASGSKAPTASAAPAAAEEPSKQAKVVMFSTSWCPSCRTARQFFTQKGVPYVDLDVERNAQAAERMVAIQRAQGLRVGSVPLIVIGGRVYQGFSKLQLEGALAQL